MNPVALSTVLLNCRESVAEARAFVRAVAGRVVDGEQLDVVMLLTSELVTNAIIHARTGARLTVRVDDGGVRVEVADAAHRLPVRRTPSVDAVGGRGVQLIDALASRWGVEPSSTGKVVWFEVAG
jgi:anti-sigma regulatory factor (Ser/Thr protein kinase)